MTNYDLPPGTTRLVLARHGQTEFNASKRFRGRADPPLTAEGDRQAQALARGSTELHPAALYSSPRGRAISTSQHLESGFGLKVIENIALDDFDYGEWTGRTEQEVKSTWPALYALWRSDPLGVRFPGGEAVRETAVRVCSFLDFLRSEHSGETVVAVSHDAIIRVAVCVVLEVGLTAYHRVAVDLASTTGLLLADTSRLLWLNRESSLVPTL